MKELILVRHAKSSWGDPSLSDFDRPLHKRGIRDAPLMAERLVKAGHTPDVLISSPALRAFTTAQIVADEFSIDPNEIVQEERLYLASVSTWLEVIHALSDELQCIVMFGHNPGITELANQLTGERIENIPTSGTVYVRFSGDSWKVVKGGFGELLLFDYPKKHQ